MICKQLNICRNTPQCIYENCVHCREVNSGSNVVCSEKKCRYSLYNPNNIPVTIFHVDGGLVSSDDPCIRCDYIYDINIHSKSVVIFIELKGMDYSKALEQVESTVRQFVKAFEDSKRYARIICTRVPKIMNNPQDIRLQKALEKLDVSLKRGTINISESISSL